MTEKTKHELLWLSIILAALAFRLGLLLTCLDGVNADQAVPGLMATHILKGVFPNFIWEYQYCGAFISYLAAINFALFGISALTFKLATFPLLLMTMFFTCKLAARIHGVTTGLLTGVLLAVSPVFVTLFTIDTRGAYPETLAFGALVLYLSDVLSRDKIENRWKARFAILGLVSGFAFWISPLIIPYVLTSWTVLLRRKAKCWPYRFLWLIFFCVIGSAPLVVYNIQHPLATFLSLGSRPFGATRADFHSGLASAGFLNMLMRYFVNYIHSIPSALMNVLSGVLAVFSAANPLMENIKLFKYCACAIYLAPLAFYALRTRKNGWVEIPIYLAGFSILFALFGFMASPRYLLPLWPAAAIALAAILAQVGQKNRLVAISLLTFLLSVNVAGALLCSKIKSPPYERLADFLVSKNLHWGYAGYWEAYPVIFLSGEKIILSPTLDLTSVHPKSKDVYPFYTNIVNKESNVFYVTNDNTRSVNIFTEKMAALKVKFRKYPLPPFMIYHSFSKRIYPEDLALPTSVSTVEEPFFY
jgi:hypothetical protein